MLFSIVVPVYNSEKTIADALESITRQKFYDVEIIIINDGSNDRSKEIILGFIEKHKDFIFKFINKENGGVSSARKSGIEVATGKYLTFLDADDCLAFNYFNCLSEAINEYNFPDCINFKYHRTKEINFSPFEGNCDNKGILLTDKNDIALAIFTRSTNNSLCNKVYKKDVFLKANLNKTIGVTMGEDRLTNILVYKYLTNFLCLKSDLYQYYENCYTYKHSKKEVVYNDTDSLALLENVIKNLSNENVIEEIRTHELDKLLSHLKTKIYFDKISFKQFKKYLLSVKNSIFYKQFLLFGYGNRTKTERFYKTSIRLIKCNFYFLDYYLLKILSKRDNRKKGC